MQLAQSLQAVCRFSAWASPNVKECGTGSVQKNEVPLYSMIPCLEHRNKARRLILRYCSQALLDFNIPGS